MFSADHRLGVPVAALLLVLIGWPAGLRAQDDQAPAQLQDLLQRATQFYQRGEYQKASDLYEQVVDLTVTALGPDHPIVAGGMNNLADLYRKQGRYAEAEPLYKRSLSIREAKLGRDHPDVAASLSALAHLYVLQGRYVQAEPLLKRSLNITEAEPALDRRYVADTLNSLGRLYQEQGRYAEAEPLLKRSLNITEAEPGPDHRYVASSLNSLASLYEAQGRYAEAEPLYKRSLKISEENLGPDHPNLAASLNNLASLYRKEGRYAEAEALYNRGLKILEENLRPDQPEVAVSLSNLASLYEAQRRYAEAEPLYKRGLKIVEEKLGPDHRYVAASLNNLANLYEIQGRHAEAEPLYERSLKICEATLGPDHPNVATTLNNLAELYRVQGRYAEAEPLYERSLKIGEAKLGLDHPGVAASLNSLAVFHAVRGHWPEAAEAFDRARRTILRHVVRVLPALAEREQVNFLTATNEAQFHGSLSLALGQPDDRARAARSAGWLLNGKGLAQQALAERALLARSSEDPAAAVLITELRDVRNRLAALTLAPAQPGKEDNPKQALEQLDEQERQLSMKLGQVTGRPRRDDPWVEPAAVREALPGDAVLVEIARFDVFDFKAKGTEKQWKPAHYAAWVIPTAGGGDVRVIDLGPAEAIDAAVAAVRAALKADIQVMSTRGEPEAEQQARPPLHELAKLVLTPLLPSIGPARQWIISPDGALWLVPWAALPLEREKYAIEDHEIDYVISGRDLVQGGGKPPQGSALVMADPDFELDPDQARAAARAVLHPRDESSTSELALRGLSSAFRLDAVTRLPGTAAEAHAIQPKLRAYAGVEPILYTDRWALEVVFKAFQRPRVVLLSTHGFFLEDQEVKPEERPLLGFELARPRTGPLPENPLLRCGLLLAGCSRSERKAQSGDEDGVLTGMEIVGTDLRGTELVVLSACDTGLGQVRNGEGVAGLRQAFQLAGAQTVVATLWQVPDNESARLMTTFFDNLANGQGKGEALRQAQLAQIKSRRERYGAAHPFFWAAYTVTGQAK